MRDWQGGPGPLPQVLQTGVGLSGYETSGLRRADALDGGEGQPHTPAAIDLFDPVLRARLIDVDRQHGYAVAAGVSDDHAAGTHARIVLALSEDDFGTRTRTPQDLTDAPGDATRTAPSTS